MVEATNFVEKTLGKRLDWDKNSETMPEAQESAPKYTPPITERKPKFIDPEPQTQQILQQPTIQIIEKIVYKKQRIHGFFRTLTIIALLTIGFLMLGESTWLITLSINSFKLHQMFPIFIIFSTIIIRSYKGIFGKIFGLMLFLVVFGWIFTIGIYTWLNPSTKRKSDSILHHDIIHTQDNTENNLYLETLIGNSYIEGSRTITGITSTRNSDRNLLVSSGNKMGIDYITFNEDSNRNVLQNYISNIDLTLPTTAPFNLIYIKNFLWLHTIDLNTFQRKTLKFHGGIDDITIRVGNVLSGNKIEIQGTAANIDMIFPKDIGVMMYYRHLIGKLQIADFDMLSGHYFQSKNIGTAKAILNIYVNLWAGNTKISRTEAKN